MVATAIHYSNWRQPLDNLRDTFQHRSKLAKLNKETWKFAQRQYSKNGFFLQLTYTVLLVTLIAFFKHLPWWWPQIAYGLSLLGFFVVYWVNRGLTEKQLKTEFDEAGRRRQLSAAAKQD